MAEKKYKTFKDLEFRPHRAYEGGFQAVMEFPNGTWVSVIHGHDLIMCGRSTYEIRSGREGYAKTRGYQTRQKISARMRYLQKMGETK